MNREIPALCVSPMKVDSQSLYNVLNGQSQAAAVEGAGAGGGHTETLVNDVKPVHRIAFQSEC